MAEHGPKTKTNSFSLFSDSWGMCSNINLFYGMSVPIPPFDVVSADSPAVLHNRQVNKQIERKIVG